MLDGLDDDEWEEQASANLSLCQYGYHDFLVEDKPCPKCVPRIGPLGRRHSAVHVFDGENPVSNETYEKIIELFGTHMRANPKKKREACRCCGNFLFPF